MNKIVILRCLQSNDVCTGAACLHAFNNKSEAFARYGDEELQLVAFFSCNGCDDCKLKHQEGLEEKMERILSLQPDAVHVGVCTIIKNEHGEKVRCEKIIDIWQRLEKAGIKVIDGTH